MYSFNFTTEIPALPSRACTTPARKCLTGFPEFPTTTSRWYHSPQLLSEVIAPATFGPTGSCTNASRISWSLPDVVNMLNMLNWTNCHPTQKVECTYMPHRHSRLTESATNWRPRNGRVMTRIAWLHCGFIIACNHWLSATVRHDRGNDGPWQNGIWQGQPEMMILSFFSLALVLIELWSPMLTLVLSRPRAMQ